MFSINMFEKIHHNAIIPTRGTQWAAGYDFHCIEDGNVSAMNGVTRFRTGIKFKPPQGYYGQLKVRSGHGVKGMILHAGTIDADYYLTEQEIVIALSSLDQSFEFKAGDRIAQMVVEPCLIEYDQTLPVRGGGFGSTGK